MDSFPWLESSFLQYKNKHSIPKTRSYSSLCEESNGLIDFTPPSGFAFRFDTSPSHVLTKSISLRLPTRAFGIGFIHQSPKNLFSDDLNLNRAFFFGPYFMYGKVSTASDGGTIEAYYSQKISSRGHFSLSSLFDNFNESLIRNSTTSNSSQSRTHFQWDFGKISLASSYCTFGKILGLQFLLNSTENLRFTVDNNNSNYENKLNFGGEVYYTAQEGSGGVSLGMRLARKCKLLTSERDDSQMIFTLTGNPLMGHYRTTLTSPFITPKISVSTRFDVNVNSFDSDLALGISYRDLYPISQGIRCSVGLKNGFVFDIQTNLTESIKIRFGLKTGPFCFKLTENDKNHNSTSNSRNSSAGSFGLDVAICN